jgi:hypothetical protein
LKRERIVHDLAEGEKRCETCAVRSSRARRQRRARIG